MMDISKLSWNSNSVTVPENLPVDTVHKWLRESVLDSHIYVTKATGFYVKSVGKRNKAGTYIARSEYLADSHLEVMTRLLDKLFINNTCEEVHIPLTKGVNTLLTTQAYMHQNPVVTLYTDPYICRVLDSSCELVVHCDIGVGYRPIEQNSRILDNQYFPMYTDFNILDYVRVLPITPGSNTIRLKFDNGYNMDYFHALLEYNQNMLINGKFSKEERAWQSSFGL